MNMSLYIRDDLADRLISGQHLPAPLTLQALAAHYGVSLTPVRAAVEQLIADGFIEKGSNRRLTVTEKRKRKQQERPGRRTVFREDPVKTISDDLVRLSLRGKTVYLREAATAKRYGMSRSAIRNILHRLAGQGLLDHIPRRGWRLRPFRQEDMQAFLDVREVLELKALRAARPHLNADDLRRLLDRNRLPLNDNEHPQIDDSLHAYLIARAGNPYIQDFFDRHGPYYRILFDWEDQDRETAIETVRQHRRILTALLNRDWREARTALAFHIRHNHPILSRLPDIRPRSEAEAVSCVRHSPAVFTGASGESADDGSP